MAKANDTKSKILQLAGELFQAYGFNGFSYNDISKPLNIKNSAIHYHFPSKADLGVALVNTYRERLQMARANIDNNSISYGERLERFLDFYRRHCCDEVPKMCPIGSVAAAFNNVPEAMHGAVKALFLETIDFLAVTLDRGRREGTFVFGGEPEHKAMNLLATLQGAIQLARINGAEALEVTIRQLRRDLQLPDYNKENASSSTEAG